MATRAEQPPRSFDPAAFSTFRFLARELDERGVVTLRYGLDDEIEFIERFELPLKEPIAHEARARVEGLLSLLHWVAGVSYYKTALPPLLACERGAPPPASAALLDQLYSHGLGELAYVNALAQLPRPRFADGSDPAAPATERPSPAAAESPAPVPPAPPAHEPRRVLVPIGGGKDSAVALEIVRRSGRELALVSVGDAAPIARTAAAAQLPRLLVRRQLDPQLAELNRAGAINGHVPVTAIVSCVALLTAALHGFDTVAMANERSASHGSVCWDGIEVNHQFSKSFAVERALSAAAAELGAGVQIFSVLRPASELAVARAFARMPRYHRAFTSCNTVFRSDPALRGAGWCGDCAKCRFVFLALAPFSAPEHMQQMFGADLLDEQRQYEGFALLTATGGHKPFECVGEEQESIAAIRLLAADRRWRGHAVVRRLAEEVLPRVPPGMGDPDAVLALSDEHALPPALLADARAVLSA